MPATALSSKTFRRRARIPLLTLSGYPSIAVFVGFDSIVEASRGGRRDNVQAYLLVGFALASSLMRRLERRRHHAVTKAPTEVRLCRVGPRFLLEVENGKPTARLDKVLALMKGLGIIALVLPGELGEGMPESG